MQCNEFMQLIDAYLDDELLVETNSSMLRHLEDCVDCRKRLGQSRALSEKLRHAIRNAPDAQPDDAFLRRAGSEIRRHALAPGFFERLRESMAHQGFRLAAAAAILVIAIGAFAILIEFRTDRTVTSEQAQVGGSGAAWQAIAETAAGDHKNCALEHGLTELPISLDEAATRFGAFNKDIDKVVEASIASDSNLKGAKLIAAHNCLYAGRRFAHIILTKDGKLISVLITNTEEALPGGSTGEADVAGFTVPQFAVFVVSDLGAAGNSAIASEIEPGLRGHLSRFAA